MFFFIGGIQPKTILLEKQSRACPICAHFDVRYKRIDHYISLFFLPLFRIKKGIPFLICQNCNVVLNEDGKAMKAGRTDEGLKCGFCRKSVETNFYYCPYCGKPI